MSEHEGQPKPPPGTTYVDWQDAAERWETAYRDVCRERYKMRDETRFLAATLESVRGQCDEARAECIQLRAAVQAHAEQIAALRQRLWEFEGGGDE